MKNNLSDLHNHLFMQLERLNDEDTTGEALKEEIHRSQAVSSIAKQVISNAALALKAEQLRFDGLIDPKAKLVGLEHSS